MIDLTARPRAAMRRDVLGASEVAEALGFGGFCDSSPMRVWRRKVADADEESEPPTDVQLRGHVLERAVCDWYAAVTGHALEEVASLHHPLVGPEPWMGATPDRVVHAPDADWLLEAKTARDRAGWGQDGSDQIPLQYLLQAIWQMAVVDCERVDVCVHGPYLDDWRVYVVVRDRGVERRVVDQARAWWERHVIGGEPPALDGSAATRDYLLACHPAPRSAHRLATGAELEAAIAYRDAIATRKAAEAREASLRARLQESIGDASGIDLGADGRIDWTARKGAERIDAKRLRAERPEIAQQYTVRAADGRTFTPRFRGDEE